MPIIVIPNTTGTNSIYVNYDTGRNVILSGIGRGNSLILTGLRESVPHNYLNGLQGGSTGEYYHLTADEYSNLVTGEANLSNYSTVAFSTGISGILQLQIDTLESNTGSYYLSSNPSGYITGLDQVSFLTLLPTGIEQTGISFPYTFNSIPRVLTDLQFISDTGYIVAAKNVASTGYVAIFSDVITETGLYLHTFANNEPSN